MTSFGRRVLKSATAGVFHYCGLRRATAALRRARSGGRRVLIVGYHRVVEDYDVELARSMPGSLISTATLLRHLREAARAGFEFGSLDQALEVLEGRRVPTKDLFVVTFDDGYRDTYRHAFPMLKALGIPAIFYLPAAMVGTRQRFDHDRLFHVMRMARERRYQPRLGSLPETARPLLEPFLKQNRPLTPVLDNLIGTLPSDELKKLIDCLANELGESADPEWGDLMNWDEARRMASAGFEFGAHTLDHVVLTFESRARCERELAGSKQILERELGARIDHFAYCNGWYSEALIEMLARHAFRSGLTTEDLPNQIGGNPFALKRKVLGEEFSLGLMGQYSPALTACCFDDVFNVIGARRPVLGKRPHPSATA
jgi:peptidoglycan/xylan/chitin deacetylase (PgdA/CDA1 family)